MIPEKWRNPHHVVYSNTFSSTPYNPSPPSALHASTALLKCDTEKKNDSAAVAFSTHVHKELGNLESSVIVNRKQLESVPRKRVHIYTCPLFFFF